MFQDYILRLVSTRHAQEGNNERGRDQLDDRCQLNKSYSFNRDQKGLSP
jgi:hypothetical protein